MADKVVQLKNKDGDKLYPVSVLPGERILWEDSMEPAPTMENIEDMTGATSSVAGKHGLVPQPSAGDQNKFLKGDGTWGEPAKQESTLTCNLNTNAVYIRSSYCDKIVDGVYRIALSLVAKQSFTANTESMLSPSGVAAFKIDGKDLTYCQFACVRRTDTSACGMTYNGTSLYFNPTSNISVDNEIQCTAIARTV